MAAELDLTSFCSLSKEDLKSNSVVPNERAQSGFFLIQIKGPLLSFVKS